VPVIVCPTCGSSHNYDNARGSYVATCLTCQSPVEVSRSREGASSWQPPPGLTDHRGQPLPETADFFAAPPDDLEPISSADSTLDFRDGPKPLARRAAVAVLYIALGWCLSRLVIYGFAVREPYARFTLQVIFSILGLAFAVWLTTFDHCCNFVGRSGTALYRCLGKRSLISDLEIFRFVPTDQLWTSIEREYLNGVYYCTHYRFRWTTVKGSLRYEIKGRFKSEASSPPPHDLYHFGLAAER
jgi:hypothetical protein